MDMRAENAGRQLELIAEGERLLNRVLGYQAAMAVHQLKDDLGIEVTELTLSVGPLSSEAIGVYRVICTIVSATGPEPIVLETIVEPEKVVASQGEQVLA